MTTKITAAAARTAAAATAIRLRNVGTCQNAVATAMGDLRDATLVAYVDTYRDVKISKITTATAVVKLVKDDTAIPAHLRWQNSTAMTYAMLTAQVILADGDTADRWTFLAGVDSTDRIVKIITALRSDLKTISDVKAVERIITGSASTAEAIERLAEEADKIKSQDGESDNSGNQDEAPEAPEADLMTLLTSALTTYRAACKMIAIEPESVTTEAEDIVKAFGGLSLAALNAVEAAQVAALKAEQSA